MGDSDAVADVANIVAMADAVAGLLTSRSLSDKEVQGVGYGARVAIELGIRHPRLVKRLALLTDLCGQPPSLLPQDGGGHLLAAWQQARDSHLFPPGDGELPTPAHLQTETWSWLKAAETIDAAWQAASAYPVAERLAAIPAHRR